ncbi:hypothetical protein GLYMA_06G207650v4 [Glycine max]|nr:hypothetical protein GLYMA_06G207650v4 [Glycine max]KAH1126904.1 hypothetical protein GYH30_015747 [Glycine max]
MNGIKEVIKSVGVLDSSNLDYHEALYNLSSQVKSLQDKHNPHLELTLSTRKKISSILEHLNRKWGNSSIAAAEVMFFPYGIQRENLVNCPRWTQESTLSAADIYAMIGSPPIFCLRFGK